MSEPYAYEVSHEDEEELVYASWLAKYADDAYREAPRIPLYKRAALTDEQIRDIAREMTNQPWGVGSRIMDCVSFARAILAAAQGE